MWKRTAEIEKKQNKTQQGFCARVSSLSDTLIFFYWIEMSPFSECLSTADSLFIVASDCSLSHKARGVCFNNQSSLILSLHINRDVVHEVSPVLEHFEVVTRLFLCWISFTWIKISSLKKKKTNQTGSWIALASQSLLALPTWANCGEEIGTFAVIDRVVVG